MAHNKPYMDKGWIPKVFLWSKGPQGRLSMLISGNEGHYAQLCGLGGVPAF